MIQKLQKFFHTDKKLGRFILIFLSYVTFWCIFYGNWLLISKNWDLAEYDIYRTLVSMVLLFLYIIIPILSFFFIPRFFKKIFEIKYPYLLNSVFILLSLLLFTYLEVLISMKHWFSF